MTRKKIYTEAETRQQMRDFAAEKGCLKELNDMFALTDQRLAHETDPVARKQITIEGIKMIEMIMTSTPDDVEINGELIKLK